MKTMVYPYTRDKDDVEGNSRKEPQGAAVRASIIGAFLAILPWVLLAVVALYQWLMKAVD